LDSQLDRRAPPMTNRNCNQNHFPAAR
jgi:hypothetical protein